jgi:hypothetical protein
MTFTISDLIVDTLKKSGVRRVYGLPGDSLNGFIEALRGNGRLAWEHVRHEETAAFAAVGALLDAALPAGPADSRGDPLARRVRPRAGVGAAASTPSA